MRKRLYSLLEYEKGKSEISKEHTAVSEEAV